jgi:hypothetical protein
MADITQLTISADARRLVAGNNGGIICVSTNSGVSWAMTNSVHAYINALAGSADGRVLLAASQNSSRSFTSTNWGQTWFTNSVPTNGAWLAAAVSAAGTTLALAGSTPTALQGRWIYSSTDSGATWISNDVPRLAWQALASSADGNLLYAASADGGIWMRRQTPAPVLHAGLTNSNLTVSWLIPSAGFLLQQNTNPASTNWFNGTNPPVLNLTNLQNQVTLPVKAAPRFFRLKEQ